MLTRRVLVIGAAPLGLAACSGGFPSSQNIAVVAQDVQIIASGLAKTLTQLAALKVPGITAGVLDVCQRALAGLQSVAQALAGVSTVGDAQPLVVRVEGYVNAFVGALATLPLPSEIQTALAAATVLLPVIEIAVNMAVPPKAAAAPMTPAQARAALK